jgi:DNA repair protein RadA/Sms
MAKSRTVYVCGECGGKSPAWSGRCPHCGKWGTLVEEAEQRKTAGGRGPVEKVSPVEIGSIPSLSGERMVSGIDEFDRVMGGGVLRGSINLIGGQPGIGKSTLMLQLSASLSREGASVLYSTGEESSAQVAGRARRTDSVSDGLMVLPATSLCSIERALEEQAPALLVVDSIQTVYAPELSSAPGSVSQVRHCTAELLRMTKTREMTTFVVGHVTKQGAIAGPKVMEHLVDAVVYFEGDSTHSYRLLRVAKNRFGSTNELGVFEMTAGGLRGVREASAYFLRREEAARPGTVVVAVMEGTRPFLVEVQALTSETRYGVPQRTAIGLDRQRLPMLLAVLEKRCGLNLGKQDVYVNVAGGMSLSDPGVDLGVCLAVASSLLDRPVRQGTVLCGEVGLGGEVRPVSFFDTRLGEVLGLGFDSLAGSLENLRASRPGGDDTLDSGGEAHSGAEGYSTVMDSIDSLLQDDSKGGSWL